jgi:N-acetylglucosamine-6-phosphate deacetylase
VSTELAIRGGCVLTPEGFRDGLDVTIGEARIVALGAAPAASQDVDASGLYVLPGFVDVHLHGAGGSASPAEMARFLPRTGVTAFLPTLAASSPDETLDFVRSVAGVTTGPGTAEVLGSHLEGPYLSPSHCGAQPGEHLRPPDPAEIERLLAAAGRTLRRVTLAPEMAGALAAIGQLTAAGVQVSLGHSACTYEQAMAAAGRGASSVTHTYNAMGAFHQRAPGLVGAALACERLVAELIADGVHVHPAAALALIRARGAAGVAIVSDGLPPLGLPPGEYAWGARTVVSDGTAVRLRSGGLAGSATSLVQALRNLVGWGVPVADAARMLSQTGARLAGAGAGERKGAIAVGFDADVVLLDRHLQVVATYCRGVADNTNLSR